MPANDHRLTTAEMAEFVANGYLRFDGLVPDVLNQQALEELRDLYPLKLGNAVRATGLNPDELGITKAKEGVQTPESLTPLSECYPPPSAIGEMLRLPQVHGIIESLAGTDPLFDHDFVHFIGANSPTGQHLHVDAVVDNRDPSFDIQLFYYPSEVKPGAGGTRFIPGSHLRYTRAEGVSRYQKILGEQHYHGSAGTVLIFHHGLWHAGQPNPSPEDRWMYKIRLNPTVPQIRLWNQDDFGALHNDPRDHTFAHARTGSVAQKLRKMQPWQKGHEARYEQMERAKLWRYLSGDQDFDVDYYHTRMERRTRANQEL